ncbi:hypothetical protein [Aquirufa antheringensis]|uniref:hypothetical protein n=1 Tax=Aquirufa antheringensis TaxID=2516559 RepID=UPI0022A85A88|nr:hypothetical protein [Aquirufa antheringensis]MCZ2487030.1 hypothetical protein [Aquirufa antheringensis]
MKKAWILQLIVICSFVLLGERVSLNPDFKASTKSFVHATSNDSDAIIAIELEDALTVFFLSKSFDWKSKLVLFIPFFALILQAQQVRTKIPPYLRFHNLRL